MGFRKQWKEEATEGIRLLRELIGPDCPEFETHASRQGWVPLTAEAIATIKEREASGYYLPEAIAARDAEAKAAAKAKKLRLRLAAKLGRELDRYWDSLPAENKT
jgi:hypothetical protein